MLTTLIHTLLPGRSVLISVLRVTQKSNRGLRPRAPPKRNCITVYDVAVPWKFADTEALLCWAPGSAVTAARLPVIIQRSNAYLADCDSGVSGSNKPGLTLIVSEVGMLD